MNYSSLKQQYPRVFLLFEKWVEEHYETTLNIWNGTIRMEDVIEFLDDNNINIQIWVKCALSGTRYYFPYIWIETDGCDIDDHLYEESTRKKATEAAITKAFEIYDTRTI